MPWIRGDQRNPAEPEEGYYAVRLVKKGPEVGAWIMRTSNYGSPLSVEEGRKSCWLALINGEAGELNEDPELHEGVQKVWLFGRKIDGQEYSFLLERYRWHKQHMPEHPFANPDKPIDLRLMPPIGG